MIIKSHFCAPPGEARRRIITQLLNIHKDDNRTIIQALLAKKVEVADTVWELGLKYVPPMGAEAESEIQPFYSIVDMLERGEFSCGDAAAYEAAVQEEKYSVPAFCMCVAQGSNDYHAIYVTAAGPTDPTEDWLRAYAMKHGLSYDPMAAAGANRWAGVY